ncbi:ribonuclease D [Jatrophihabitans sp. GAS493]|uniref:HRDC domain-containing protein n=1 Tax=Jatrophihabitans sp. GAS493 TaxID=1907575 RepID=UPI000BB70014|nr:ribonuclease D [Jatrophihabitans sp. GAS493]SOD74073.1 ribonuclease D [Jatrophihabitans sp. GAS493]
MTDGESQPEAPNEDRPEPVLLATPVDGVGETVTTPAGLAEVVARFAAGEGPVAVDAERASGYRYSQRAYLVQLRRHGAGTALIDPIELPDLSSLNDVIGSVEWVLHAANQDLPCLAEIGLVPSSLFDTELAGRLLGDDRVALGTMVDKHLGMRLEKGHSAADWSVRPLPRDWLVYAALDVELLVELRDVLAAQLTEAGKLEWARQEFEAVRSAPVPPPRDERWRRTSGIHAVRSRRALAAVRALWLARDEFARERDIAPGRVLPDSAIIAAVRANASTVEGLAELSVFSGPRQRRNLSRWAGALTAARALTNEELPTMAAVSDAVPPTSRWRDREPDAADRLARCREVVADLAAEYDVLAQNLLASDVLRRLAWQPPLPPAAEIDSGESAQISETAIVTALSGLGARPWQIELCAAGLATALTAAYNEVHTATATAAEAEPSTAEPTREG